MYMYVNYINVYMEPLVVVLLTGCLCYACQVALTFFSKILSSLPHLWLSVDIYIYRDCSLKYLDEITKDQCSVY